MNQSLSQALRVGFLIAYLIVLVVSSAALKNSSGHIGITPARD
jgi:hypothetical protein